MHGLMERKGFCEGSRLCLSCAVHVWASDLMSLNLRTAVLLSLGNPTATVPLRMVLPESVLAAFLPVRVQGEGDEELVLSWFWIVKQVP